MMWNTARENGEARLQGDGMVAVAVDKDKSCQHALKWAIDNLFPRDKPIKLVHVNQTQSLFSSSQGSDDTLNQQEADAKTMDLLLPYRCFCTRRQVQFEVVLLNDQDVVRALSDYVSHSGVEILLLGASSKNGLSRIFKNSDVPSSVMKTAPDFCSVYVIYKGKVSAARLATRTPPPISMVERTRSVHHNYHADQNMSYDELSVAENENSSSHGGSGRQSTDSNYESFYESLGSGLEPDSSILGSEIIPTSKTDYSDALNELPCYENSSFSLQIQLEHMENEMIRLKMELKRTMDMYHVACKEALTSKQKIMEFEDRKMKQEQRMREVESAAMEVVEKERARCKEATEAAQRLAEQEIEKRVLKAEWTAHMEAEEKKKVWDALGQSQSVLKYERSFHILVVLFLSYLYFSLLQ